MTLSKPLAIVSWTLQIIVALILFQTLFFKFTGAEESKYIFTTLGMEPWGRIGSGVAELICAALLLIPRTITLGAIGSLGVISGAIVSHLTRLGIEVKGDGGLLFYLAVAVFAGSAAILFVRRRQVPFIGHWFRRPFAGGGDKKRILILGGGFGGIYSAIELEKTLARDGDIDITLVSTDNFFLFTPMLHEVAASDLDITNIVSPIRKLIRRINFFNGDVKAIDTAARKVTVAHGDGHCHELPYDYLVIGLGSLTNFYNLPGVAENCVTMKTLGDAIHLRNRLIASMEEADTECAKAIREPLMTFVVVGGGFSGVETVGGLHDFLHASLRFYPNIKPANVRTILIHSGDVVLPELGPELGAYAQKKLSEEGVRIITNAKLASATADEITLSTGEVIRTRNVIWTAGTTPHPLLSLLRCAMERGRIKVDATLAVEGQSNLFALGDCAVIPDIRNPGKSHPPTAQHAIRQAKTLAHNLEATIRGGKKEEFDFVTLGQLAAIGRRTGVAKVLGFKFSGFIAWWMWRSIYLSKLPRFEKKLRVALDWTLDLFFSKDLVQFLTVRHEALAGDDMLVEPKIVVAKCDTVGAMETSNV